MPKPTTEGPETNAELFVPIGKWAVASAPARIRTLLGSCSGVVLYDRTARIGGLAHIVLPNSRGATDQPGKYADTAIPALIADLDRLAGRKCLPRLSAKILGGASMFQTSNPSMNIGKQNNEAVERLLAGLGVPILARDLGGEAGRRLTFDTVSGTVSIKVPGGAEYDI